MAVCSLLTACGSTQLPGPPVVLATKPIKLVTPPKIALVLGGGAARGFAHVGVIKVLEANHIVPDIIVGTSAGSVVGAIYSSGMSAADLQRTAIGLEDAAVGDWSVSSRGLIRGEALQALVNRLTGNKPLERFPRKFAATAVDLNSGALTVFERGNAGVAVRASSSVPGIFLPTKINNIEYVDGGVISPVPVRTARKLGADIVIAVDISARVSPLRSPGAIDISLQSLSILTETLANFECEEADVVIRPKVGQVGSTDFNSRNLLILEGEQAALAELPKIREKLARQRPTF